MRGAGAGATATGTGSVVWGEEKGVPATTRSLLQPRQPDRRAGGQDPGAGHPPLARAAEDPDQPAHDQRLPHGGEPGRVRLAALGRRHAHAEVWSQRVHGYSYTRWR